MADLNFEEFFCRTRSLREKHLEWIAKKKRAEKKAKKISQDKRLHYIILLGEKCVKCGESNKELLEFDHIDPTIKLFNIASRVGVLTELKKCQLLCRKCHYKKHGKEIRFTLRFEDCYVQKQ